MKKDEGSPFKIMEVCVLIPAYNESKHIAATLQSLQTAGQWNEIIVVDDGSSDETGRLAGQNGATVIRLPVNRGKGGAINAAFPYIKSKTVLVVDADLQESAKNTIALVEPVSAGIADMTIARFPREKSGAGFGIAKKTAICGIRLLTGKTISAPLSGQRCMKTAVLADLLPLAPRFGLEVGMTIDALRKGYRIYEIETELFHAPPGRDMPGFIHRGKQFVDICLALGTRVGRIN